MHNGFELFKEYMHKAIYENMIIKRISEKNFPFEVCLKFIKKLFLYDLIPYLKKLLIWILEIFTFSIYIFKNKS